MVHRKYIRLAAVLVMVFLLGAWMPVSAASSERLSVEREVFDYLTDELGLSTAAACGVLANIEHESAFQPTVIGDKGTSYGLCQWHNGRYTALRTYCGALGLDYRTVEGQMAYLKYELGNNYTSLLLTLQSMDNTPEGAYRAAYLWCVQFERPSNTEVKAAARGELARGKYWSRYNSFEPIIIILPQAEEEEPKPEVIIEQLKQNPVTIPLPPEEAEDHTRQYVAEKPEMVYYTPYHLPQTQEPVEERTGWELPTLGAIALAAVTVWVFPEKKRPGKVYRWGRDMVK